MNEELTLAVDQIRQRPQDRTWFVPVRLDDWRIPDRTIGGGEQFGDIHFIDCFSDSPTDVAGRIVAALFSGDGDRRN